MRALSAPMNQRRSIRLKEYDYTEHGAYFVTICTQDKQCLFGEVIEDSMALNETEKMIQTIWSEIPIYYPWIEIDSFQIMPNHMHGIIIIDQDLQIGDHGGSPLHASQQIQTRYGQTPVFAMRMLIKQKPRNKLIIPYHPDVNFLSHTSLLVSNPSRPIGT